MEIELEGAPREISQKALKLLLSEKDAKDLHEGAHKLLSSLEEDLPWKHVVSTASLEGEALACALEDYQSSPLASAEEVETIEGLLDLF